MERKLIAAILIIAGFLTVFSACSNTMLDDVKEKIIGDQIAAGIDPFPDAPKVSASFSTDASEPTNLGSIPVTISFSEQITEFGITMMECTNCTASDLVTEDNIIFTLIVEPVKDGKVQIVIPQNTVQSTATYKKNTEAVFEIVYDGTAPAMPVITGITPTPNLRPTWNWSGNGEDDTIFRYKLNDSDFSTGATETTETSFTPASDLEETVWRLYLQERDTAGNWSAIASFAIEINTEVPEVPVFNVESIDRYTIDRTPTWSWSSGGNGGSGTYRYKINDSEMATGTTTITGISYTLSPQAPDDATIDYTLYLQEQSSAGLWSGTSSYTITVDNENPPLPGIILPEDTHGADDGIYRTQIDVTVDSDTIETGCTLTYRWRQNSGTWTASADFEDKVTFYGTNGNDINYDIEITQTDKAGNFVSNTTNFSIDRKIPSAPGISGITSGTIGEPDSFTITYETGATAYYTTNGSNYSTYTGEVALNGSSGDTVTYSVNAYQKDVAGNQSTTSATYTVIIDREPPNAPNVGTSGTTSSPTEDTTPTWAWTSGGNGGSGYFSFRLDNASRNTSDDGLELSQYTLSPAVTEDATHTLYVWERDAYNNWSSSGSHSITIDIHPAGTFYINSNSTATTDREIECNSNVTNATQMRFKNSEDSSYSDWVTYSQVYAMTLEGADGSNTIDAQYRDTQNNLLDISDSINYSPGWSDVDYDDLKLWTMSSTSISQTLTAGNGFVVKHRASSAVITYDYCKVEINSRSGGDYNVSVVNYYWDSSSAQAKTSYSSTSADWECADGSTIYIDLDDGSVHTSSVSDAEISIFYDYINQFSSTNTITCLNTGNGNRMDLWTPSD